MSRLASMLLFLSVIAGCATDTIESRRFGQQVICHSGSETLTVSNADSFVHLDHGDAVGPCPER